MIGNLTAGFFSGQSRVDQAGHIIGVNEEDIILPDGNGRPVFTDHGDQSGRAGVFVPEIGEIAVIPPPHASGRITGFVRT